MRSAALLVLALFVSSAFAQSGQATILGGWGMGPWGAGAQFTDPTAYWIWAYAGADSWSNGATETSNYQIFVTVNADVAITVYCIVDNVATLYVNGMNIGDCSGGWTTTNYPRYGALLTQGTNAIVIRAHNQGGPAGLIAAVRRNSDGALLLHTDNSWSFCTNCPVPVPDATLTVDSQDYRFTVVSKAALWADARQTCQNMVIQGKTGWLATPNSPAEYVTIKAAVSAASYNGWGDAFWLGGSDIAQNNRWRWISGPLVNAEGGYGYTFWVTGGGCQSGSYCPWYPCCNIPTSGSSANRHHAYMHGYQGSFYWESDNEMNPHPYVCQHAIVTTANLPCSNTKTDCASISAACASMPSGAIKTACLNANTTCAAVSDRCNLLYQGCSPIYLMPT